MNLFMNIKKQELQIVPCLYMNEKITHIRDKDEKIQDNTLTVN